jgi:hypothetical protein
MAMTPEEVYALWAPDESPWSAWAKPVLFTALGRVVAPTLLPLPPDLTWAPAAAARTVVVVDLPGADAVWAGLALARQGFRPVPLFNGCLAPAMLVDVAPVAAALLAGCAVLREVVLADAAPPAFLLDSRRRENSNRARPGEFDNRWAVVPQDMPSGTHLRAAGITTVMVRAARIQEDLAHILCRYQQAGVRLLHGADDAIPAEPLTVEPPSRFRSLWYCLGVFAGLRRNSAGGFGAVVPQPSSAGHG